MTRTSLITGASSGLGAEYARHLARRGDRLVLVARDQERLEALAHELRPSVSAVIPRSTYGAVKSWQVQFSRWANGSYRPRGVTVTAVCPGYTHTDFHARPGLARGEEGMPNWMWLEATRVVDESLRNAARGKAVSVPS